MSAERAGLSHAWTTCSPLAAKRLSMEAVPPSRSTRLVLPARRLFSHPEDDRVFVDAAVISATGWSPGDAVQIATPSGKTAAARYQIARTNARRYAEGLADILKNYDAILTLSAPGIAPKGTATGNPVFNSLWTLAGLPAVSLPLLTGEAGMPLGVQLVGPAGGDARLLRTAKWLADKVCA